MQKYECNLEETIEKLQASDSKYEIAEKEFLDKDDDVSNSKLFKKNHLSVMIVTFMVDVVAVPLRTS